MKRYTKPAGSKDAKENGRIILAHGEVTGHSHEVICPARGPEEGEDDGADLPAMDIFDEPSGRRVLLITRACELTHQEHGPIALDPQRPIQARQGDVLLNPLGKGAWEVIRQREFSAEQARQVAD
jgi:hypothetical protein